METRGKTLVGEGLIFGVLSGIALMVAEVVAAVATGVPAIRPSQMAASIVLGRSAFTAGGDDIAVLGNAVHLALSALFGLAYSELLGRAPGATARSYAREAGLGLAYGAALWALNFQLIARAAYPWFLDAPQFQQAVLHAVFYGLPLGLMLAAGERRVAALSALNEQPT